MLYILLLVTLVQLSTSIFDPELHAKFLTLPRDEFIRYFNSQNYSWKINHHPHLDDRHIACAKNISGPFEGVENVYHDPSTFADLPENFDAREKWSNCPTIKEIYDQGACGSCWTFGTATVLSDRTCIQKGVIVRLSEQDFTCTFRGLCLGGIPVLAFGSWMQYGLVSQECRPYDLFGAWSGKCIQTCVDPKIDYAGDKHNGVSINTVVGDDDVIKAEIVNNGPIQAAFIVYQDFVNFSSGVYEHKYGEVVGGHSVRVIGYGVEKGVDYWLMTNSWGESWGNNGLAKVKRHQPELRFESGLLAGTPRK